MFCTAPALVVCAADVDDPVPGKNGPQRRGADRDDTDIQFQRKARALPSPEQVILSDGKTVLPVDPDTPDVPIGNEPIRIRVETSQGIFLVFDAANSPFEPRRYAGFAAYWQDKTEEELYLYDRLLFDFVDVGHALANLERDLGVDIEIIHTSDDWLADAFQVAWDQREDTADWIRPGEGSIA